MKQTRLEKAVGTQLFNQLLPLYKEVKQTRDIHKILLFKSFIARIMHVQYEYDEYGKKCWATLEDYFRDVILYNSSNAPLSNNTPLKYILHLAENEGAYKYKLKRDLRKTL